jgi:DNA mismatch endonuclease (patch repair protein)
MTRKYAPPAETHMVVREGYVIEVDDETSKRMATVRQRDTKPEKIVRQVLHSLGLRFRIDNRDLPGSPDIANRKRKWAVFVHGCYWHRHAGCRLATTPRRNAEFWQAKFDRNINRDVARLDDLRSRGYECLVIWECETRDEMKLRQTLRRWLTVIAPS